MQCRKVEPNVIMNSARLAQRPVEANKMEEEIIHVMKSPDKKSPKNSKSLKSASSGPIINLQQQIIIHQSAPTKDSQVLLKFQNQMKKKKKKKKTQKKQKAETIEKQGSEVRIDQILKSNLKKYQKEKQEQMLKEEMQKQRVVSLNEMRKMMDQQIRQLNQQRFVRSRSPPSSMLPWGVNQNKLKQYWTKMLEIHDKLENPNEMNQNATEQAIKEKMRRHKLGLDFLNSKPEKQIQKMIQKQKSKQVLENVQSPKNQKSNCENKEAEQDLKLYILYKRELWRHQKIEEKKQQKLKKEKLEQNLQILEKEAKLFAKSRNASMKSSLAVQVAPSNGQQSSQHFRTSEPPNFNKLEKEYKELMRSLRQSSYSSAQSHTRKTSQIKFIDWFQKLPESYLQEQLSQMQSINEQMNNKGFQYKLSEQEMYQFLEQFLKEKFEQQTKSTIKDRFNELQERFQQASQQQSSNSQLQCLQQNVNPQSHQSNKSQNQKEQASKSPKEPIQNEISEEQLEHVYNVAATIIQKIWRGYKTRQVVFEYLEYLISQEELEEQEKEEQKLQQQFEGLSQEEEIKSVSQMYDSEIKINPLELQQQDSPNPQYQDKPILPLESLQQSSSRDTKSIPNQTIDQFLEEQSSPQKSIQQQQKSEQSQLQIQEQENNPNSQQASEKNIHLYHGLNSDPEYFMQVIKLREEALQLKYDQQLALLEKMLDKKKVSTDLFSENKDKLDKRYKRERDKLQQSKNEVERLHQMFKDTIKSTQKDQQFMERMKVQTDEDNLSIWQIFSIRSETEQSDVEIEKKQTPHYGLLQQIKNDQFKKYSKNRKQVRSFDQQVSLDEISMKNEEIQTSTLFNVHTESINHSLHKSLQLTSTLQQSIPSQEAVQTEQIEVPENKVIQLKECSDSSIIPFDDRKIDNLTDYIVQNIISEFAEEMNDFPLQSLGILMEWDEESQLDQQFPPGFPTTLNFIKDYLVSFSEFIQKHYLAIFLEQINTPLGITPSDLLKTISLTGMSSNVLDDSTSGPLYPLIKHIHQMEPLIEEEIWSKFNQSYALKLKYFNDINISEEFKELEIYHLRMIYEAFNESINYIRPYGIRGQPYPWKSNPLKVYQNQTTKESIDRSMGFAISKMLKWGSFLCGFIPEKIETPQGEIIVIEDDYLNSIKEDRLQQMLEYEIQESEEKWLNYEEEQAEVAVEISDVVFETMLDEAAEEIFKISQAYKFQT
ncbi:unnamed protein product (macronuclear) [Paramecium tetraurelia]|uniref:DUF4378 domain-containing protein n=1 Tax=Paramecium tetraurelia TaxID=5888 RepID=A0BCQ2_PARTE|nr:uncharacterized protein GSPATT00004413001 [Paramecium tetraurelia]CAK56319.1 unnamed protein product [Paramecium tetraurelia]|eukprot:XP_001423717.1 hypothetical protein (macronuclear) [Paramecium tetraurelia strain d4-2]